MVFNVTIIIDIINTMKHTTLASVDATVGPVEFLFIDVTAHEFGRIDANTLVLLLLTQVVPSTSNST